MFKKIIILVLVLISVLGAVHAADANCDTNLEATVCTIDTNGSGIFNPVITPVIPITVEQTNILGLVYFTGIGCPHCAKVDPILLKKMPFDNNNLAIIEYEVKLNAENAKLMLEYNNEFQSGIKFPLIILNQYEFYISGDIITKVERSLEQGKTNNVPFPVSVYEKGTTAFENLEFSKLAGKPAIWYNSKVISRYQDGQEPVDDKILHLILEAKTIEELEKIITDNDLNYFTIEDTKIQLSQTDINFNNTTHIPGWKVYYNGESSLSYKACPITTEITEPDCAEKKKIPLLTVVSLALVDAVNPCEFAVLIMLLIGIMTAHPKNKKRTLYAGLAFTAAIFILYFIYGVLLINIFKLIPAIDTIRTIVYTAIAIIAITIGLFQLKDFFFYKPGGFLTEMPLSFRPKVHKLITGVTSPGGAFLVGAFVTLFLMPCTIGPYVILGNLLATETILAALPQLLLYNIIFILPMLVITFIVYFGVKKVEQVAEWKSRNVRYMHLIAGIIMLLIGIGMLLGWF